MYSMLILVQTPSVKFVGTGLVLFVQWVPVCRGCGPWLWDWLPVSTLSGAYAMWHWNYLDIKTFQQPLLLHVCYRSHLSLKTKGHEINTWIPNPIFLRIWWGKANWFSKNYSTWVVVCSTCILAHYSEQPISSTGLENQNFSCRNTSSKAFKLLWVDWL